MSVYRDKNTKNWVVTLRYRDQSGKIRRRAKRGFKTKREALKWENDFLDTINIDPNLSKTLNQFFKLYLTNMKPKIRETTYELKKRMYRLYIEEPLGDKILSEITVPDILNWQNGVLENNFKPSTSRTINNQLAAIFNHASRYYDLKNNPMKKVDPMGSERSGKMKYWTLDEFNQFLTAVENPIIQLMFKVLFFTGIRIGELTALRLKNFNYEKSHLNITHTARYENGDYIFNKPKTTSSERLVTLPNFLNEELNEYIDNYNITNLSEQLFETCRNKMGYYIRTYAKNAGVKRIRIHDLRHSHASLLINEGVQPNIVQQRLGHENIETTLRTYSHMYPNKQYELASFINTMVERNEINRHNDNPVMIQTVK